MTNFSYSLFKFSDSFFLSGSGIALSREFFILTIVFFRCRISIWFLFIIFFSSLIFTTYPYIVLWCPLFVCSLFPSGLWRYLRQLESLCHQVQCPTFLWGGFYQFFFFLWINRAFLFLWMLCNLLFLLAGHIDYHNVLTLEIRSPLVQGVQLLVDDKQNYCFFKRWLFQTICKCCILCHVWSWCLCSVSYMFSQWPHRGFPCTQKENTSILSL